ncbi:MAG: MOSC domain-containing protein [Thermoanaerobaculia bacterium]
MERAPMRLASVNVAFPREIAYRGRRVWTGIYKEPVGGRVRARFLNLEGDRQADLRVHGGRDKAVYAYDLENSRFWAERLGGEIPPGQFGENLTVEGMKEDDVRIGDRYRVGTAVVEVSEPRSPCFKLGVKMGSPAFLKPFLESGRTGFYLRVIEEGELGAGDPIETVSRDPAGVTVLDATRLLFSTDMDVAIATRALEIATLSSGLRRAISERLARATS